MSYADYRPYLPNAEQSRIAGETSEEHAAGRLATPRAQELFRQWGEISRQPFVGITTGGRPQEGLFELKREGAPSEQMASAAWKLLRRLSDAERSRAHQSLDSQEWRNWQNTEIFVEKHGLRLEHASRVVRELVLEVLRTSLSDKGYRNTVGTMKLNAFLGVLIDAPGVLGEWSYNFCIYGEPSSLRPWGWQLWGHHLAISCLTVGGQMVLTPCFMGAEICYADQGSYNGLVLFKDHERLGLELMNSLPPEFQDKAVLGRSLTGKDLPEGRVHFADYLMLGGAYQDNRIVPYEGVEASRFNTNHRNRLFNLVEAYIGTMPDTARSAKMAQFERHLTETHFCWIGGNGPDDPFYYRIQSPVIFIEFDHHPGLFLTNTEALKYHVHTIVRTPNGNDYGLDLMRQHYQNSHRHKDGFKHDHV